jgi:hypothetical protein
VGQRVGSGELAGAQLRGRLDQGQRVPPGAGRQLVHHLVGNAGARALFDQRPHRRRRQRGQRQLCDVRGAEKARCVVVASREHDRHRLGEQPPRHEQQRIPRGSIQPLQVVDQAQHRSRLAQLGQQRQRSERHHERIELVALLLAERHPQRPPLRGRQRTQTVQRRTQQSVQRREREGGLRLQTGRPQHPEAAIARRDVVQQRRLAHPGLAPDQQARGLPCARGLEHLRESSSLHVATVQHRTSLGRPGRAIPAI